MGLLLCLSWNLGAATNEKQESETKEKQKLKTKYKNFLLCFFYIPSPLASEVLMIRSLLTELRNILKYRQETNRIISMEISNYFQFFFPFSLWGCCCFQIKKDGYEFLSTSNCMSPSSYPSAHLSSFFLIMEIYN